MNLFSRLKRLGGAACKNSATLPVTAAAETPVDSTEVFKTIAEDKLLGSKPTPEIVDMVQEEKITVADGADEQMLGSGGPDEKLAGRDEVKFIKGDHQNGDAKIDIGHVNGKAAFTGMSKEELMKYANDPFWVRLRWIFFVGFWVIWAAMLVGAIMIIIGAPKCAAPQPLPWYKRGPHAKFAGIEAAKPDDVETAKKIHATGAIYELPAALTYSVSQPEVEQQIKKLVAQYQASDVKVILDLTPNYVGKESKLVQDALENKEKRAAFVWVSGRSVPPTNWLKVGGNRSAWEQLDDSYVLSQFQDGYYDLKMNSSIIRNEFGGVLRHLVELGVQGFRLKNTKFFVLSDSLEDEVISAVPKDLNLGPSEYGFYDHKQTTFLSGLGDVLYEYLSIVKNASADAFLSVAEDIVQPEVYQLSEVAGANGIDLPMYGNFVKVLSKSKPEKSLFKNLENTLLQAGNGSWLQWNFRDVYVDTPHDPSALALFLSMLPGVPVVSVDAIEYQNVTEKTYKHIEQLRHSASYMHGELKLYEADPLVAFSRIKSGNPGYFVIFNPTDSPQSSNITNAHDLPDKMTVSVFSENFNNYEEGDKVTPLGKVSLGDLKVAPQSAIILTYVPVKTE
ncbi:neutral and basic amino acid transport protein rBAT isoform X2 [Drosophila pseudoobscura]|uniref:alpha-glucosidase n=1 Tax=Drosophila pseudoobscura pseudoobscura TaxID=46245 RepID=A0A6I8UQ59_DROPS|nr:neutral and basic amino acid transport protein rBAT isoform X2 [Drosophila pseudoobscura]